MSFGFIAPITEWVVTKMIYPPDCVHNLLPLFLSMSCNAFKITSLIFYVFSVLCLLCLCERMYLVVTCKEKADLLALVCDVQL